MRIEELKNRIRCLEQDGEKCEKARKQMDDKLRYNATQDEKVRALEQENSRQIERFQGVVATLEARKKEFGEKALQLAEVQRLLDALVRERGEKLQKLADDQQAKLAEQKRVIDLKKAEQLAKLEKQRSALNKDQIDQIIGTSQQANVDQKVLRLIEEKDVVLKQQKLKHTLQLDQLEDELRNAAKKLDGELSAAQNSVTKQYEPQLNAYEQMIKILRLAIDGLFRQIEELATLAGWPRLDPSEAQHSAIDHPLQEAKEQLKTLQVSTRSLSQRLEKLREQQELQDKQAPELQAVLARCRSQVESL